MNSVSFHPEGECETAKRRMEAMRRPPMWLADWVPALMVHFRVAPRILQPQVPLPLDLHDGAAWVSLVAFRMRNFRFRAGGRWTRWLTGPVAEHSFLNVRTYVRRDDEPGIFFLSEFLDCRLATLLGPRIYGLPYHYARNDYRFDYRAGRMTAAVIRKNLHLAYEAAWNPQQSFNAAPSGSPDAFLMERYTAYTRRGDVRRMFRICHDPWPQTRAAVTLGETSLLEQTAPWFRRAEYAFANYSPGVRDVRLSAPVRMEASP